MPDREMVGRIESAIFRVFKIAAASAKAGGLDGMKCDADGNIFATGPGGVCVMAPDGTLLGRFLTGDRTANLCFGGDDGRTLFVCVNHRIGMVRTTTKGIGW